MKRVTVTMMLLLLTTLTYGAPTDSLEPYGTIPNEEFTNNSYYDGFFKTYTFEYIGKDNISYVINPNSWEVQTGFINVQTRINGVVSWPINMGGLRFRTELWNPDILPDDESKVEEYHTGIFLEPIDYRSETEVTMTDINFTDGVLAIDYKDIYAGYEHTWRVEYSIKGKTLVFHIYATDGSKDALGNYCGVFFDRSYMTNNPRWYVLPYIVESNIVFDDQFFYSTYVDRAKSNASNIHVKPLPYSNDSIYSGVDTIYFVNQDGKQAPLDETCYLTISTHLLDVFPAMRNPKSTTKAMMDDKIVLDIVSAKNFRTQGNEFQQVYNVMSNLYDYGFKKVFVINHTWQNHGYDKGLPDDYPPGEIYGGLENFKKTTQFANDKGWLYSAHEDYTVMNRPGADESDYYNVDDVTKKRSGDPFIKHYSFHSIKADQMLKFAELESVPLKQECNTTAAFLDLHAGNNPWEVRQIDLGSDNEASNTFKEGVEYTKQLFDYMRNLHGGPVVGEGGIGWGRYDTFYAGYLDGVDRWPERNTKVFIVPEHELTVIRPMQVNFGLGQYDRFFIEIASGFSNYDFDLYRAIEIAFGHAGYVQLKSIGSDSPNIAYSKFCREYYMMQQLQKRYMPSNVKPTEILYYLDNKWITQDELILRAPSMEDVLLKLKYSNGLTIWINHKNQDYIWEPEIVNGISVPIPRHGFVALNTNGELFVECSIMLGNYRVDYVQSDQYIYLENRTHTPTSFGYLSTDGMASVGVNKVGYLDLHLIEGTYLSETITGSKLLEASTSCHLNIIYDNNIDEFDLTAPYPQSSSLNVKIYALPSSWIKNTSGYKVSDHVAIYAVDSNGAELPALNLSISTVTGKELVINNITSGTRYRVRYSE
jgi:hypothetical protein